MGAFKGYIWLCICILFAVGTWILNVTVLDNAYPPILDEITNIFPNSFMDNTDQAIFFMKMIDYSPLLMVLFGIIGFVIETQIFGTSVEEY
jgi:hypothetical protein